MKPAELFDILEQNSINFYAGVPDSLLKDFCAYITDNTTSLNHTIAANEGNAIALAAGHHLATGNPAVVYMQNSGIGNCVNPLLSLTDEEVYSIPLLMFIGWRGEPNVKDEPQHIKQGKVTDKLLDAMGIKYQILPEDFELARPLILNAISYIKQNSVPFAFIIRKGTFEKYTLQKKPTTNFELKREDAIEAVIRHLNSNDVIVATTGHISREVYEIRNKFLQSHKQDFLTVGSMGHASSIALGIALNKPDGNIYCFDGDGACLMHQGALAVNASKELKNFKHIVFNNEAHDSVGGQVNANSNVSLAEIALNSGYKKAYVAKTEQELNEFLPLFIQDDCTTFLEIKVRCGARDDLGRPKEKPQENKRLFMQNLKQVDFVYRGAIENLSRVLKFECAKKALIFTGKSSYLIHKELVEAELLAVDFEYYNNFSCNPKEDEVKSALDAVKSDFDIILAVGGGSVIDFAKAFKYYSKSDKKLIAIPTTAGTGSEATQFAVLYINGTKTSLDKPEILPEYAIVDSQFVENNPKYLKACTAMDAFCQAVESYWAVKSTDESRSYAKEAIELCRDNIVEYVNNIDIVASENMARASHLAGKAINISRTTAAHALSYKITSEYGLPHGHAVALSIRDLFKANMNIDEETCNNPRGVEFVKDRMNELMQILKIQNVDEYWNNLLNELNLEYSFEKLGITNRELIVNSVNLDRLKNNPKNIEKDVVYFWSR